MIVYRTWLQCDLAEVVIEQVYWLRQPTNNEVFVLLVEALVQILNLVRESPISQNVQDPIGICFGPLPSSP